MLHSINREDLRHRAACSASLLPRPFLRWAGSKRWLLPQLIDLLPPSFNAYYEPFLGSGALFFLLQPKIALLADACGELIETFRAVRDRTPWIQRYLSQMTLCKRDYYQIRNDRSEDRIKRAAEFIYLNRGCFNGLYRVNSRGDFNVPFGRPKTRNIIDPAVLDACSSSLRRRGVRLYQADFEAAVAKAKSGDLVYLDPPYVTGHNDNGFIDFSGRGT